MPTKTASPSGSFVNLNSGGEGSRASVSGAATVTGGGSRSLGATAGVAVNSTSVGTVAAMPTKTASPAASTAHNPTSSPDPSSSSLPQTPPPSEPRRWRADPPRSPSVASLANQYGGAASPPRRRSVTTTRDGGEKTLSSSSQDWSTGQPEGAGDSRPRILGDGGGVKPGASPFGSLSGLASLAGARGSVSRGGSLELSLEDSAGLGLGRSLVGGGEGGRGGQVRRVGGGEGPSFDGSADLKGGGGERGVREDMSRPRPVSYSGRGDLSATPRTSTTQQPAGDESDASMASSTSKLRPKKSFSNLEEAVKSIKNISTTPPAPKPSSTITATAPPPRAIPDHHPTMSDLVRTFEGRGGGEDAVGSRSLSSVSMTVVPPMDSASLSTSRPGTAAAGVSQSLSTWSQRQWVGGQGKVGEEGSEGSECADVSGAEGSDRGSSMKGGVGRTCTRGMPPYRTTGSSPLRGRVSFAPIVSSTPVTRATPTTLGLTSSSTMMRTRARSVPSAPSVTASSRMSTDSDSDRSSCSVAFRTAMDRFRTLDASSESESEVESDAGRRGDGGGMRFGQGGNLRGFRWRDEQGGERGSVVGGVGRERLDSGGSGSTGVSVGSLTTFGGGPTDAQVSSSLNHSGITAADLETLDALRRFVVSTASASSASSVSSVTSSTPIAHREQQALTRFSLPTTTSPSHHHHHPTFTHQPDQPLSTTTQQQSPPHPPHHQHPAFTYQPQPPLSTTTQQQPPPHPPHSQHPTTQPQPYPITHPLFPVTSDHRDSLVPSIYSETARSSTLEGGPESPGTDVKPEAPPMTQLAEAARVFAQQLAGVMTVSGGGGMAQGSSISASTLMNGGGGGAGAGVGVDPGLTTTAFGNVHLVLTPFGYVPLNQFLALASLVASAQPGLGLPVAGDGDMRGGVKQEEGGLGEGVSLVKPMGSSSSLDGLTGERRENGGGGEGYGGRTASETHSRGRRSSVPEKEGDDGRSPAASQASVVRTGRGGQKSRSKSRSRSVARNESLDACAVEDVGTADEAGGETTSEDLGGDRGRRVGHQEARASPPSKRRSQTVAPLRRSRSVEGTLPNDASLRIQKGVDEERVDDRGGRRSGSLIGSRGGEGGDDDVDKDLPLPPMPMDLIEKARNASTSKRNSQQDALTASSPLPGHRRTSIHHDDKSIQTPVSHLAPSSMAGEAGDSISPALESTSSERPTVRPHSSRPTSASSSSSASVPHRSLLKLDSDASLHPNRPPTPPEIIPVPDFPSMGGKSADDDDDGDDGILMGMDAMAFAAAKRRNEVAKELTLLSDKKKVSVTGGASARPAVNAISPPSTPSATSNGGKRRRSQSVPPSSPKSRTSIGLSSRHELPPEFWAAGHEPLPPVPPLPEGMDSEKVSPGSDAGKKKSILRRNTRSPFFPASSPDVRQASEGEALSPSNSQSPGSGVGPGIFASSSTKAPHLQTLMASSVPVLSPQHPVGPVKPIGKKMSGLFKKREKGGVVTSPGSPGAEGQEDMSVQTSQPMLQQQQAAAASSSNFGLRSGWLKKAFTKKDIAIHKPQS
ncbi:hypothetical protein HDU67_008688 [Dinochytrium kinnereticum]|nr:hypothetical protein HDU67_008688 [Dinochytrium kinnereticum]